MAKSIPVSQPRFVNLWDAGLAPDIVRAVASAIDASVVGVKGSEAWHRHERVKRFLIVRQDPSAPPSTGEARLVLPADAKRGKAGDPMRLVRRLRSAAVEIGCRQFYVPKAPRGGLSVGAEDARWLRRKGHSVQSIADLFGVSQRSAWVVVHDEPINEKARAGLMGRNVGHVFRDDDFRAGADWLRKRRLPGDPTSLAPQRGVDEIVKLLGPARVARVGAALRDLRAAKRHDPPAVS